MQVETLIVPHVVTLRHVGNFGLKFIANCHCNHKLGFVIAILKINCVSMPLKQPIFQPKFF